MECTHGYGTSLKGSSFYDGLSWSEDGLTKCFGHIDGTARALRMEMGATKVQTFFYISETLIPF